MNLISDLSGDLARPRFQQNACRFVGQLLGAENAGQRGQHDEEREHGHQRRQRDVAGDGPAVIGKELPEGVERHAPCLLEKPHA